LLKPETKHFVQNEIHLRLKILISFLSRIVTLTRREKKNILLKIQSGLSKTNQAGNTPSDGAMKLGIMTLDKMTIGIMTLVIMPLGIMPLDTMPLS
jgi:hypothetical protein